MRKILTATLSTLLLTGCMAEWKGVDHPDRRTALEGQPGVSCAPSRQRPGMRMKDEPLCLTQSGWAEYDQRQRMAATSPDSGPSHHGPGMPFQPQTGNWKQ